MKFMTYSWIIGRNWSIDIVDIKTRDLLSILPVYNPEPDESE